MGIVYEAFDRERQERVALKTLRNYDAANIYRLKQEFRTLADVSHPNLVRLYELVATDRDEAFFAMELVEGTDFIEYVRGEQKPPGNNATEIVTVANTVRPGRPGASPETDSARPARRAGPDFDRLCAALHQLVVGVHALHEAGKLHRDLKPSNVRVTPEGRVVILDFGVATELRRHSSATSDEDEIVGTVMYMAPEQACGETPVRASDWYGVGSMLYEAIVGQPPFIGPAVDVITMKTAVDPIPPRECVDGVPRELDALCCALLHREPSMRPDGLEVLRRLAEIWSTPPAAGSGTIMTTADAEPIPLVGRDKDLRALHEAFVAARGRCVTVRVSGRAGTGKSAVVQRFLDDLVDSGQAVALRGRAYEREVVPYKAVDSVIDALSHYLSKLEQERPDLPLPGDAWALARLFPVLRRVPRIAEMQEQAIADPHRLRRRAFVALRDLLGSLANVKPLVLFVDDAHWGDADSAALLLELVRPPHAPSVMILMTYREREAQSSPFLNELRARWPPAADLRNVQISPLDNPEARALALALLDASSESASRLASAIARESGGNPFLIEELVRSAGSMMGQASHDSASIALASATLEQMVSQRLASLPEDALRLLEIVAISGRPVHVSTAIRAAGAPLRADDVVGLLRTRRFIRAGLRDGREVVEVIHGRIGETIVAQLPEDVARQRHQQIARVLEEAPDTDAEALATHLLRSGEATRAAQFAERGAEQAVHKLAFDQAARLLRLAVQSHPASTADGQRLRKRLGEVLDWAGRCTDSAQVYLEAAGGASGLEKLDLQRAAAEQFLAAGRMEEGTRVLHGVLEEVGLRAPRSRLSAVFWLFAYRLWLRIVPWRFQDRAPATISAEVRLRLDAIAAAGLGMTLVDSLVGFSLKARLLVAALRWGDRSVVFRAATFVANDCAADGGQEGTLERDLMRLASDLGEKETSPLAQFSFRITTGLSLFFRGRFKEARERLEPLHAVLTNRKIGQYSGMLFTLYSIYLMGDLKELTQRYSRLLADADERENLFMSVALRTGAAPHVWLATDDPASARRELREAMAKWPRDRFSTPEWRAIVFGAEIDLYEGRVADGYDRVRGLGRIMWRNGFVLVQYIRGLTDFVCARCTIASVDVVPDSARRARLAEARRLQRRLERTGMPWLMALGAMVDASVQQAVGDRSAAVAALRRAISDAQATDMALHAAAAQYQLGRSLAGDEGADLTRQAREAMTALGVVAPDRYATMLVPGKWDA
jgi:serine/threonine protein kinase